MLKTSSPVPPGASKNVETRRQAPTFGRSTSMPLQTSRLNVTSVTAWPPNVAVVPEGISNLKSSPLTPMLLPVV